MKIAVIVSTYNRPDTLVKVLEGLMGQTRDPDEVIIADDGSADDTRQAVLPFLASQKIRVKHVWHADEGFQLAKIRNRAINASDCDYLVFLDGDCIPEPHFVQDHMTMAKRGWYFQGKRILVRQKAAHSFSFADTTSVFRLIRHALRHNISNRHHIIRLPFFPVVTRKTLSGIKGCNMAFYKKDLETVNGFNNEFTGWGREDSEIVARLFNSGIKRREHPFMAICYHLWHPENTRDRLKMNDNLLEKALSSGQYRCQHGLNVDDG